MKSIIVIQDVSKERYEREATRVVDKGYRPTHFTVVKDVVQGRLMYVGQFKKKRKWL